MQAVPFSGAPSGARLLRLAVWLLSPCWLASMAGASRPRHAHRHQVQHKSRQHLPHHSLHHAGASLEELRQWQRAEGEVADEGAGEALDHQSGHETDKAPRAHVGNEHAASVEDGQPGGLPQEGQVDSEQGHAGSDASASHASGEAGHGGSQSSEEHGEEHANREHEVKAAYLKVMFGPADLAWDDYERHLQEREETEVGWVVAVCILGGIILNSTLMYLTNCSDPQIRAYSYKLISSIIVVFLALGVTHALHALIHDLCGHSANATTIIDFGMLVLFLGWFFSVRWSASACRDHPKRRHAFLNVNLHIAAFILFECVGEWQEHTAKSLIAGSDEFRHGWEKNIFADAKTSVGAVRIHLWLLYILVPVVVFLVLWVMSFATSAFFARGTEHGEAVQSHPVQAEGSGTGEHGANLPDGHELKHQHNDWEHDAFHAETDISAIAVGFLLKQLIVFATSGMHAAPMECDEFPIECKPDAVRMSLMTGFAVSLHCITVFIAFSGWISPTASKIQMHMSMTSVWVALQVARDISTHLILTNLTADSAVHSPTMMTLTTAAMLSPLYILSIIAVDALADRGLLSDVTAEEGIVALALLTGLFWEKVADSAITHVSEEMHVHFMVGLGARLIFLLPLAPAWFWYIIPIACQPVPPRVDEEGHELFNEGAMGLTGVKDHREMHGEQKQLSAQQSPQ